MKCRNWRTEDPERSGKIRKARNLRNLRKDPESPEASGKGPSGPLRNIRNLRKSQAQAAPHANICFLPQNHRLCADLFALPPRIYARNAARPCTADRKTHPPRTIIRFLAFPSGTGRRPLRKIRNLRKNRKTRKLRKNRKLRNPPEPPKPSAPGTPIICNLIYYNLRYNTHIFIINNKLFTLFLARFKIKPYLCIV